MLSAGLGVRRNPHDSLEDATAEVTTPFLASGTRQQLPPGPAPRHAPRRRRLHRPQVPLGRVRAAHAQVPPPRPAPPTSPRRRWPAGSEDVAAPPGASALGSWSRPARASSGRNGAAGEEKTCWLVGNERKIRKEKDGIVSKANNVGGAPRAILGSKFRHARKRGKRKAASRTNNQGGKGT